MGFGGGGGGAPMIIYMPVPVPPEPLKVESRSPAELDAARRKARGGSRTSLVGLDELNTAKTLLGG